MVGWQLARSLIIAQDLASRSVDVDFMQAKIATARFYAEHILAKVPGIRNSIVDGAESVTALPADMY
ncbi:hypothetical protein D9M72_636740 [compost metagenome]